MRVKRVNRYYCDFCKKTNCSGASISKHERSCTLNPKRICRMCALMEGGEEVAEPLPVLIALLPDSSAFHAIDYRDYEAADRIRRDLSEAIAVALPALRKAAANCPACIMAALRQSKIPVPMAEGFDFKTECTAVWEIVNAERRAEASNYAYAY